ncbi:MAG TPA: hypothetical protein VMY41_15465 [Thermohalobaculum sp.]|nr:hypothetical protein [Thermohalobaculum sp.]
MTRILFAAIVAISFAGSVAAAYADENDSYYYPPISSEEVFSRDLGAAPPAGRAVRVGFATQITKAQLAAPDSPRFVIFAKGDEAQHMIVLALDDQIFKTIYRARAVLAQLTSNARGTDFFIQNGIEFHATWFDLAKLLGFEDLVISDGVTWSHRVVLE